MTYKDITKLAREMIERCNTVSICDNTNCEYYKYCNQHYDILSYSITGDEEELAEALKEVV